MYDYDLELCVLSCLLIRPELMEKLKVEDKYFVKHQRTWKFMKSFYNKFKTFDIALMYSVCSNKYHLVEYLEQLVSIDVDYWNFEKYQDALIEQYELSKKDRMIINKIYELANDLYVGKVKVDEFLDKANEIYTKIEQNYNKM